MGSDGIMLNAFILRAEFSGFETRVQWIVVAISMLL